MRARVHAILRTSRQLGADVSFPFVDLAAFAGSFSPSLVQVEFIRRGDGGTLVDLELRLDGPDASNSRAMFCEALVRSEVALDFECLFPHAPTPELAHARRYLSVSAPDTCLPSGKPIAVPLTLAATVRSVFAMAHSFDAPVSYRVRLERVDGDPDLARSLVPAVAEVRRRGRAAANIEAAATEALEVAHTGGWRATEEVGILETDASRHAGWLERSILEELQQRIPFDSAALALQWRHSGGALGDDTLQDRVSRLRPLEYLSALFRYIVPSDSAAPVLSSQSHAMPARAVASAPGSYAFLSYAQQNVDVVNHLTERFEAAGMSLWRDTDLDVGSRWEEGLEEKIRGCGAMVAFVTKEYQCSRYCRRELKFADLIEKSIVPISPDGANWEPGLQMMFQELQLMSVGDERSVQSCLASIRRTAPQIFSSPG